MGIWALTIKDIRIILQDRGALYTLLALPVVFIAILGVSTGQLLSTRDELKLIKIGLVDEDKTELSEQVYHDLSMIGGLKVDKISTRDDAAIRLQDGRSGIVIVLGKDFDDRVEELDLSDVFDAQNGKLSQGVEALDMQVLSGASYVGVSDLVEYVVLSAVLKVVSPEVVRRNPLLRRLIDRMKERHAEDALPKPPVIAVVKSGSSIIYQTLVPAFIVMFAFFLVNIMASSFISERQLGTLKRMQTTRITPSQLLCGKTLPFLLISIAQSSLLFLSGKIMFGMSWGTYPFLLIPVIITTAVSATGLGLLLATFVRTESQVASYSTFLVVVLAGISGCYMPRDWLPELMKTVSLGTPHAWALIAYQELLTHPHPSLNVVGECCLMLLGFGVIAFILGWIRFRKLEYHI
ncbi:ABC transporter permease [Schlesneria paludicola]|uniref:ABC transporter permease n=1 Tax=Schlesneria paludicola TaxID=360056 RepID=UPI00029B0A29|nr:ABC transporter permease [Schlesneria paludicola]